ncbi:MAG: ABC transporter permease, partial [Oscillospiraceae bacterium]|nr:ABC transporter permease [Oscillospiraceae bacterium]
VIVGPEQVFQALLKNASSGFLWKNVWASLERVLYGFLLGAACAIPLAILLGWYKLFRAIVEPWIQFMRTIPPIALCPMVIALFGVGIAAKVAIIFFAVLLVMVVTIYQGVKNVDVTLIKAARVLGASQAEIFFDVVIPASFPYILVAISLGLAAALSTLIAAELTGAVLGLGNMIQVAASYFDMDVVMLGVLVIGTIGFIFDKLVLFLERKLTGWQEIRQ